jgi:hypothetical protein
MIYLVLVKKFFFLFSNYSGMHFQPQFYQTYISNTTEASIIVRQLSALDLLYFLIACSNNLIFVLIFNYVSHNLQLKLNPC